MRTSTPNPILSRSSKVGTGKIQCQIDNRWPDVECNGQAVIIRGEGYTSDKEKITDHEDRNDADDDASGDSSDGELDEPAGPPTQPTSVSVGQ